MIVHKIESRQKFHPMGCFDVRSCSQVWSVRRMDLISHHHLLGTVVIRDYDLLSHKYCLRHASLVAPYQLLCWAPFGTRKHKSSSPLGSAHFNFLCASPPNEVVLKSRIQKGRVIMLLGFVYVQLLVFNMAICFWAGACLCNVVLTGVLHHLEQVLQSSLGFSSYCFKQDRGIYVKFQSFLLNLMSLFSWDRF